MRSRIQDFRLDVPESHVVEGTAAYVRSVSTLAYLTYLPLFLHFRQLTEFVLGRRVVSPGEPELGGWLSMPSIADCGAISAVTYLLLDRHGPVVLSTPTIDDRYWSVAVLDASFDNIAVIGTSTCGERAATHLVVGPGGGRDVEVPDGMDGVIEATTNALCLIQRIAVVGSEDEIVHRLQASIQVTSLDRWRAGERGLGPVDVDDLTVPDDRANDDVLEFFAWCQRYAAINPSVGDGALVRAFEEVGLGPGGSPPSSANERAAIGGGARAAQRAIDATLSSMPAHRGWWLPDRRVGTAEMPTLLRAATQMVLTGLPPVSEAASFVAHSDAMGEPLHGSNRYELRCSEGLPSVRGHGFWSLTLYDEHGRQAADPFRWSAGRTGTDELVVLLQHDPPRDDHHSVWLPTPQGSFHLAWCVVLGDHQVVDGSWTPPAVSRR